MAIKDLSVEDVTKGLINQGDAGLAGRFLNNVNNGSLTQAAQNAGVTDTQVTPSIDVSELGTTQVEDLPADSVSSIEGQIRALAGIQSTPEIDNTENILSALGQGTADLQIEAGNLPKERAELEAQAGIPEFQKQQRDVMTQMAQLQAQLTSDLELITEQNRQEGGLAFASAGERGRRARQAAAEMAGLNAVNQALQGNIATAQQAINTQMEIKYGAIEGQLNAQKTLIEMNEGRMNRAEKRLADQRQTEINLAMNKLEQLRSREEEASQSIITAMQNGLSSQVGSDLMQKLSKGEIEPSSVFAKTGGFLRDPLDVAIKQLEYDTKLQEFNSVSEVLDSEFGTIINSTANLVGAERGKNTRREMAQAIKNQDYKTAFSYVVNNVEEKLTGENATKFGNQITDSYALLGLREAIQRYADAGGDLGLLRGKAEDISNRLLGVTGNPELTALATQLNREFQTYRTNATGAAFSPEESREYAKVNPRTTASLDLNLAVIDGALNQLNNRIESTITPRVPGAMQLYDLATGGNNSVGGYLDTVDQAISGDDFLDEFLTGLSTSPTI